MREPFSAVVSVPEALFLVRSISSGTPESALVVSELHNEVPYHRCLVDDADIVEHAVALGSELFDDAHDQELTRRVLRLRRPIHVSYAKRLGPARIAVTTSSADLRGVVAAAAVVEFRALGESQSRVHVRAGDSDFEVDVRFEQRVYKCTGVLVGAEKLPGS